MFAELAHDLVSPKDKHVVCEETSKDDIWWKSVNVLHGIGTTSVFVDANIIIV